MTNKARIKIAAGVTALFLAGICAAGLAVRDGQPQAPTTVTAPSVATPAPNAEADKATSGEGRDVVAALEAVVAAASGEHPDVAAALKAVVAAASGKHPDVAAALEAVVAAASGKHRDVAAALEAVVGGESEREDDE